MKLNCFDNIESLKYINENIMFGAGYMGAPTTAIRVKHHPSLLILSVSSLWYQ